MKSTLLLATAIAAVAAQSQGTVDEGRLFYTEPTSATVWTAGQNHTVAWNNLCKPENTGDLNIVLYRSTGGNGGTEQVRVPGISAIGKLNCREQKEAMVFIPASIMSGTQYSIHVDTVPLQSYSAQFTIKGTEPEIPASTTAPTNTVMPTGPSSTATSTTTTGVAPTATTDPEAAGKDNNGAGALKSLGSSAVLIAMGAAAYMF
ncbi:hypothetical protein BG004_001803 [Podila humilis]|nr:hypothetical protein BG004_001803 [Podila humilis]